MNNINTVFVFDLDDTLVETTKANNFAYIEAYKCVMGRDFEWNGGRITRMVFDNIDRATMKKIVDVKEKIFTRFLDSTYALPSMRICKALKGEKKILLSYSSRVRGVQICNYYGILEDFDYMLFKEDFLATNKYNSLVLKLDPENLIVFEDNEDDIKDAIASGISKKNIFIQKNK